MAKNKRKSKNYNNLRKQYENVSSDIVSKGRTRFKSKASKASINRTREASEKTQSNYLKQDLSRTGIYIAFSAIVLVSTYFLLK